MSTVFLTTRQKRIMTKWSSALIVMLLLFNLWTPMGAGMVFAEEVGSAAVLAIELPNQVKAGEAVEVTVSAMDTEGNVATGYLGTVGFSSSDAKAVLPENYTFVDSDNGTKRFTVTFQTTGAATLTVQDVLNRELAGYWKLDEGSGNSVADASGYDRNGEFNSEPVWSENVPGTIFNNTGSVQFDGVDDYIEVDSLLEDDNNLSISAWINWQGTTDREQLIAYNGNPLSNGCGLYIRADGTLSILCGGAGFIESSAQVPIGSWQHVTAVRKDNVWELYLNGNKLELTGDTELFWPDGTILIGGFKKESFNGLIDDVRLYSTGLQEPDILRLAAGGPVSDGTADFEIVSGAAAKIEALSGYSQVAELNSRFAAPFKVRVTDNCYNPVADAAVTFRAPESGCSGTFADDNVTDTVYTDENGEAESPVFTANGVAGKYVVTADYSGIGNASFEVVNTDSTWTGIGIYVNPDANPGNVDVYNTIQQAVYAANEGDTITVANGTFTENVVIDKSVTIKSQWGHEYTVIDGMQAGPCFNITADSNVTLEGLTLTNGLQGLVVSNPRSINLTLKDNIISNNKCGGVQVKAKNTITASVTGNNISNNEKIESKVSYGGGIRMVTTGTDPANSISATIEDNTLYWNDGGSIRLGWWDDVTQMVYGNITAKINNNTIEDGTGGMLRVKAKASVDTAITNNVFKSDRFGSQVGGVIQLGFGNCNKDSWVTEDIKAYIKDNEINMGTPDDAVITGGICRIVGKVVYSEILSNHITSGYATDGVIRIGFADSDKLLAKNVTANISGNQMDLSYKLVEGQASQGIGGGIRVFATDNITVDVKDNILAGMENLQGGGIRLGDACKVDPVKNMTATVSDNYVRSFNGGGIRIVSTDTISSSVLNNTVEECYGGAIRIGTWCEGDVNNWVTASVDAAVIGNKVADNHAEGILVNAVDRLSGCISRNDVSGTLECDPSMQASSYSGTGIAVGDTENYPDGTNLKIGPGNTVDDSAVTGIFVGANNTRIFGNTISGSDLGVYLGTNTNGNFVEYNNLSAGMYSVIGENDGFQPDARLNWWGTENGPKADTVLGNVYTDPWIQSAAFDRSAVELVPGDSAKVTLNASTLDTENRLDTVNVPTDKVYFTSSDETVATIADDGTIKALKPGTATITANLANNPSVNVTVTEVQRTGGHRSSGSGNTITTITLPPVAGSITSPFIDVPSNHWAVKEIVYLTEQSIVCGYPGDTYQPDKDVTRAEFAVIVAKALKLDLGSSENNGSFSDVPENHWAFKEIEALSKAGITVGYNGNFTPEAKVTREEAVRIIINALHYSGHNVEVDLGSLNRFVDAASIPEWAKSDVAEAVQRGIICGISENCFGSGMTVDRAQVAVMICKMLKI